MDACVAMVPKVGGDSTPLGHKPLCVLPIVHRFWASARLQQLQGWFGSWAPNSVFSAGGGRSSVEACCSTALDLEESLSGALDSCVHIFVADDESLSTRWTRVFGQKMFLVFLWPSMSHSFYCVLSGAQGEVSVHRHRPLKFVQSVSDIDICGHAHFVNHRPKHHNNNDSNNPTRESR